MAPHFIPGWIPDSAGNDPLMSVMLVFLILAVVGLGIFYLKLHALPEHLAERGAGQTQLQIVSVLALLALFTHNNLFWILALLLAMINLPDFLSPIHRIADALENSKKYVNQKASEET